MKIEEINENGIIIRNIIHTEEDYTNEEIKSNRLLICENCENYLNGICNICECIILTKILYIDSKCPINKW